MQYIIVLSGLVTIFVGLIAAYQFIKGIQHPIARRPGAILGVITLILIVFTIVLANSPSLQAGKALNPTPTLGTAQLSAATTTPQQTPSPTPTATPTPTPTPLPQPGTVLYQANWSNGMNGWGGSDDWKTSSGLLLNDGTQSNSISIAPYIPGNSSIADYAVEAYIQLNRYSDAGAFGGLDSFGIIVRSPDGQKGYEFAVCASAGFQTCGSNSHEIFISNGTQNIAENPYQPKNNDWHIYRMEVKGNTMRVLVDGRPFLNGSDNMFLAGGQVGLWSNKSVITVRSFKVIAL